MAVNIPLGTERMRNAAKCLCTDSKPISVCKFAFLFAFSCSLVSTFSDLVKTHVEGEGY